MVARSTPRGPQRWRRLLTWQAALALALPGPPDEELHHPPSRLDGRRHRPVASPAVDIALEAAPAAEVVKPRIAAPALEAAPAAEVVKPSEALALEAIPTAEVVKPIVAQALEADSAAEVVRPIEAPALEAIPAAELMQPLVTSALEAALVAVEVEKPIVAMALVSPPAAEVVVGVTKLMCNILLMTTACANASG